jgi:branched-subunit amino acid transport protein AzlD
MAVDDPAFIVLAIGTIGTYALRALPVTAISRLHLPDFVRTWLIFVAEAILSAYVALFLFWDAARGNIRLDPAALLAIGLVIALHLWKRNLLLSIFAGVMTFGLFDLWLQLAAEGAP